MTPKRLLKRDFRLETFLMFPFKLVVTWVHRFEEAQEEEAQGAE